MTYPPRYVAICPAGHASAQQLAPTELREAADDGWLALFCETCRRTWAPDRDEQARIRDWADSHGRNDRAQLTLGGNSR